MYNIWNKKFFGVKKILSHILRSFLTEGGVGPYSYLSLGFQHLKHNALYFEEKHCIKRANIEDWIIIVAEFEKT